MATALSLIMSACAKDDWNWLVGTPITVTASAEQPATRSGANIQTSNFEEGATINAYYNITNGDAIGKTPTILTASAPNNGKNALTPDVQPYYPESGTVDIMALYPTTVTNLTTDFTVAANQTDDADYKACDLMWAGTTGEAKKTGDIDLQFAHLMAKMSVTVTAKEGVLLKKISLINVVRTVPVTLAASGYTIGLVGTESDATKKTILLASTASTEVNNQLSGSVLFPPQTIGGQFIKVETNFGDAYYSVTDKEFEQGAAYSANLTLKRQDIGFTTAITDWADNGGSIAVPPGSSAGLHIENIPEQAYDGTPKTPTLTITYTPNDDIGGDLAGHTYPLVANKDYVAEYYNNTNQGTAMVIITGQKSPDRTGNQEALADIIKQIKSMTSFEIKAAPGQIAYPSTEKEVEYDYNTTVDFALNKNGGDGKFTYTSSNPAVADVTVSGIVTIRSAGSTRITANMDNSGNYGAATAYYDLTVKPRSIKDHYKADGTGVITATLAATSFPYQGTAYSPAVVVKDNGRTLQENKHFTYSVVNNTNVGTATITIRGMGNYSCADADVITKTFNITGITPNITFDNTAVTLPKGQKYTRRAKTDYGTITYSSSPAGYVTISSAGVVTAINTAANSQPQTVTITASVAADGTHGDWVAASKSYQLTVVESEWEYLYSGGRIQTWECPVDGVYQLEAMGAQGATTGGFNGGRGAHIAGQVFVKKGQKLYIYLGQAGTLQPDELSGGWNGGGTYGGTETATDNNEKRYAGGGGATDFSLIQVNEDDWATDNHLKSRILVAGGGGGALYCSTVISTKTYIYCGGGGNGGGEAAEGRAEYAGEAGFGGSHPGGGGTLSAGGAVASGAGSAQAGSFGKGGNYSGTLSAGCGGGGWYGGASGGTGTRQGAGGGGSSFIYNQANLSAQTTAYTIIMPAATTPASNFFVKTQAEATSGKVLLEITPSNLVCGGSSDANGQARITYMSAE